MPTYKRPSQSETDSIFRNLARDRQAPGADVVPPPAEITWTDLKEVSDKELKEILDQSSLFYQSHNLIELAQALPVDIRLSEENREIIKKALNGEFGKVKFSRAMAFPAISGQTEIGISRFKQELSDKPYPDLSAENQYTASYLDETVKSSHSLEKKAEKKRQKPYLLLYSPGLIPEETKGLTYPQAEKLFQEKSWSGLSYYEGQMLSRRECEEKKDHQFDVYSADPDQSQWTWYLASRVPSGCVCGRWSPGSRRVRVVWSGSAVADVSLGARPAVVVPLEI